MSNKAAIDEYIERELKEGTLYGPFDEVPFKNAVLSPLSTTGKRESDEKRVIHDLSFPHGSSVNDMIPKNTYLGKPFSLRFPTVDKFAELIKRKGRGCAIFKKDLRRCYKQIKVDPGDVHLLGFTWEGKFYFDNTLPMGLRSSAYCCQRTTDGIKYMYQQEGYDLENYLDDLAGAEWWSHADAAYSTLGEVLDDTGTEESKHKAWGPSVRMPYLGVLFDTIDLTMAVTEDRLKELNSLLEVWANKTCANKKEVQSIIGKLSFVASCVRPGRIFISRMLSFLRGMGDLTRKPLSEDFLKD